MLSKINVTNIVRDHWSTLRHSATHRLRPADLVLFYGGPLIPAVLWFGFKVDPKEEPFWTVTLTSLSIFAGLLLNLLVLLYGLIHRAEGDREKTTGNGDPLAESKVRKARDSLLREVYYNVSYEVLVAVIAILFMAFSMIGNDTGVGQWLAAILVYLLAHFVLTIFMVMKRVHSLLSHEFRTSQRDAKDSEA